MPRRDLPRKSLAKDDPAEFGVLQPRPSLSHREWLATGCASAYGIDMTASNLLAMYAVLRSACCFSLCLRHIRLTDVGSLHVKVRLITQTRHEFGMASTPKDRHARLMRLTAHCCDVLPTKKDSKNSNGNDRVHQLPIGAVKPWYFLLVVLYLLVGG
jgi:hypothetical protein